jgi:Killing trait
MRSIHLASAIVALCLAVGGCAAHPDSAAIPAALLPSAAMRLPASHADKPLDYRLTIENKLGDTLNVSVTPGKDATLTGSPAFELKPGERETVTLTIPSYEPGTIATLSAHNAVNQQQMLNTISLAATNQGVLLIYSIDVATGLDEKTSSLLTGTNDSFTVIAEKKP